MGGVIPRVLALVAVWCFRGFAAMALGLVGSLVVVTGGADVATFYSVATLCLLGSSPSVATLRGSCRSISIVVSNLMMAF